MKFADAIERPIDNVLVVDALNLAFRWKHQKAEKFVEQYVSTVYSLANSYKCGTIIITADNHGSTYRKEIYPEYKGNRVKDDDDYFLEKFIPEYLRCLEAFRARGVSVFETYGIEADDIAAFICKKRELLQINKIWLISSDKDWDLLIDDHISRFSYVTRKEVRLDNWPYEVTPEQYISFKVLQGDSGDNVKGIPQVGPKRAISLIEQYGDALEIYANLPLPGSYKYIQNLNNSGDLIPLNYDLMDIMSTCEDILGEDMCAHIFMEIEDNLICQENNH
jgi:DNA polymerase-1